MGKTQKELDDTAASKEEKARRKQMEAIASHLRSKVPCKNAVIKGQKVEYFVSSKAVDCLMESKWTKMPKEDDYVTPYFTSRADVSKYLGDMLLRKFFLRANKVEVRPKGEDSLAGEKAGREGEGRRKKEKVTDSPRARKRQQEKESLDEDGKKKKKKFRLELHTQQIFRDSDDQLYVWQYDPPSYTSYIIGFGVVIVAIAVTLQPLWPDSTRVGFWYLSTLLFGIIGVLVAVIVVRWFLFGIVLIVTAGKVTFWILPNLDNDKVDFLGSFTPLYLVEFKSQKKSSKKKKTKEETSESAEIASSEEVANEDESKEQDAAETSAGNNGTAEELESP